MRITSKGQVTIPAEIREKAGFLPDTEVDFILDENSVRIVRKGGSRKPSRGDALVRRLRGTATVRLSTEEIMSLTRER